MTHLKKTLGYDKDTLPDFIEQKGIDLAKEPLEIMPSEGMQGGSSEVNSSGIMIDETTASTVPGLFAAGDCSDQMRCVHICTTGGYLAGKMAAEYAKAFGKGPKVKMSQAKQLKKRTFAPLQASGTTPHRQFEDTMRKMLWQNAGPARNEKSLTVALEKLEELGTYLKSIGARNYHELTRVLENGTDLAGRKDDVHRFAGPKGNPVWRLSSSYRLPGNKAGLRWTDRVVENGARDQDGV